MADYDLIFAGGGLAACLTALRVAKARPDARLAICEGQDRLAGDHFWSFHDTDVAPDTLGWLRPLAAHHWDAQRVVFPERERTLTTGYNSVTSERLDAAVRALPKVEVRTGVRVAQADPGKLVLEDQAVLTGPVLDARGALPSPHVTVGFQKFLGQWLRTEAPHGVTVPTIMDATVPQTDGYRFLYVLPLGPDLLHVEDTYYADGDDVPTEGLRAEIANYAAREGWGGFAVEREEQGVLPIVLEGDVDAYWASLAGGPAPLGMRAGLFNQITGYSLPEAAMTAETIADEMTGLTAPPDPSALFGLVEGHAKRVWAQQSFYRALNRMLFRAADPELRYVVLQRHYGLSQPLIERFYAGQSTIRDKARILAGKPPVPIHKAIRALPPRRAA